LVSTISGIVSEPEKNSIFFQYQPQSAEAVWQSYGSVNTGGCVLDENSGTTHST